MDEDYFSDNSIPESLWDRDDEEFCDSLGYEEFCDPLDYECPKCGIWGEFIHNEEELIHHGYSKSSAPHGICVNCAWIDPNTKIKSDSIFDLEKFSNQNGVTNASKLEYVPRSKSEKENLMRMSPYYDLGANKAAKYRIKSLYRSAITEDRYRMMEPPYFVGNRNNLFKPESELSKKASETDPERYTYIGTNNDWFLSLFKSFKLLEEYLRKSDIEGLKPKRLPYALITTYLHKHHEYNNVEPLWVFMKRMKLGKKQFKRRLDDWIIPTPSYHDAQIDSLSNQPTVVHILNLISIISNHAIDIKLSQKEITEMKSESIRIYDKLQSKKITNSKLVSEPESLLNYLSSKARFSGSMSINGNEFHAAGLIEALCVNHSAHIVLDSRKAKNLEKKFLFPIDNGKPWWRQELSQEANKIVHQFSKYIDVL